MSNIAPIIIRQLPNDPDGTKRRISYAFTTFNIEKGEIYLDEVWEEYLPPGRHRWGIVTVYSRLTPTRALYKEESAVYVPPDVVIEILETIRNNIHFSLWSERTR